MRKQALLVGIPAAGDLGAPFLSSVEQDLEILGSVLRAQDGPDFASVETVGPSADKTTCISIKKGIERFFKEEARSTLNLLYVTAHASVSHNGLLHVLASDYEQRSPAATSVPVTFLADCLPHGEQNCSIVILDCCFADRGAWDLFSRQTAVLDFGSKRPPSYCLVSSTRDSDPAVDGLFAPLLAEALDSLDPDPQFGGTVTLERVFDYVSQGLSASYQMPRLWQSRTTSLPLGRSIAGVRASRSNVQELYEFAPGRGLQAVTSSQALWADYVESSTTEQGFTLRTGVRVLEGKPSQEEIHSAVAHLDQAASANEIDNGLVIVTDSNGLLTLRSQKVLVRSFADFRRAILPTFSYLTNWVTDYEALDPVHTDRCYISLDAHEESSGRSVQLDRYILDWIDDPNSAPILLILGDFGAGKTTTLRRTFWEQARRHLSSPASRRLPIWVSLREIDGALDVEALVERSVAKVSGARRMNYHELDELNKDGRVLWLLDGFDEMAVRVSEHIILRNFQQILRLAKGKSRMAMTCRTSFFKNQDELEKVLRVTAAYDQLRAAASGKYEILDVDELTDDAIRNYILANAADGRALLRVLGESDEFRNLAGRPILLQMIVQSLPALLSVSSEINMARVYLEYTSDLLLRDGWRNTLEGADRRKFCQFLAWRFYSTGEYEISYSEFPSLIKDLFPEDVRVAEDWKALEIAVRSTSFLSRDQAGQFAFAHKSFMEFFAAAHILDSLCSREGADDLLGRAILSTEVSRFLAQLTSSDTPAASKLLTLAASSKFSLRHFLLRYLRERLVPVARASQSMTFAQRDVAVKILVFAMLGLFYLAAASVLLLWRSSPSLDSMRLDFLAWLSLLLAVPISILLTALVLFLIYCWRVFSGREGNPYCRLNATAVAVEAGLLPGSSAADDLVGALPERDRDSATRLLQSSFGVKAKAALAVEEVAISKGEKAPVNRRILAWIMGNLACIILLIGGGMLIDLSSSSSDSQLLPAILTFTLLAGASALIARLLALILRQRMDSWHLYDLGMGLLAIALPLSMALAKGYLILPVLVGLVAVMYLAISGTAFCGGSCLLSSAVRWRLFGMIALWTVSWMCHPYVGATLLAGVTGGAAGILFFDAWRRGVSFAAGLVVAVGALRLVESLLMLDGEVVYILSSFIALFAMGLLRTIFAFVHACVYYAKKRTGGGFFRILRWKGART